MFEKFLQLISPLTPDQQIAAVFALIVFVIMAFFTALFILERILFPKNRR